jgi:hypothetical protein
MTLRLFAYAAAAASCALAGLACNDVNHFTTDPDEAYCGAIVDGAFVREGFDASVQARMTFDSDRINTGPGSLWTSDGFFVASSLRPIPKLMNDPLSMLNFGDGRDRNLMEAIDPSDPTKGPGLLAVVSLMHDNSVELRLIRGAPALDGGPPPQGDGAPLFALFPLHRAKLQSADCTF